MKIGIYLLYTNARISWPQPTLGWAEITRAPFATCPVKAVGKESFTTCQSRQLAKNPLPLANKGSRQRIS